MGRAIYMADLNMPREVLEREPKKPVYSGKMWKMKLSLLMVYLSRCNY